MIVIDIITFKLDEVIENIKAISGLPPYYESIINQGIEEILVQGVDFIRRDALEIIETGEPRGEPPYGIPDNMGTYATMKSVGQIYKQSMGAWIEIPPTDHPLGILTGELYIGVQEAPVQTRMTRGNEIRVYIAFHNPEYISYVHDGKATTLPRPFMDIASRKFESQTLEPAVEELFKQLRIDSPTPEFMASSISETLMRQYLQRFHQPGAFTVW